MRSRGLLWIALAMLRADRRGALLDAAAACVGAAALVFFLALGLGVSASARRMFPADARLVEVLPGNVTLGGVLGGGRLDDDAVRRLAALPGAAAAWPRLSLRVPVAASGPPAGMQYNWPPGMTLQVPVVGVAPELLGGDVGAGLRFEDGGPGGTIPVVLSRRLLEIYDKTIAPAWGVRRLPAGLSIVGVELPVRVGFSIVPQKTEDRIVEARLKLVGLSDRVPIYQLAMPLQTVRRLHAEYGKPDQGFTQVTLLAASPDAVPALTAAVRRMGLSVDEGERASAERVGTVVAVTTGALVFLAGVMCALAALAIARSLSASVRGRVKEIAVLQALGAAPSDVRGVVLAEGALVGLAGGLVGVALAIAAMPLADRAAAALLPDFPFRPETFFARPAWLALLGLAVPVLAAVLGALAPAALAARVDPARALS
ncbi:MAG TPA: FtsX-like permease family protein [Anaeromyxobacter sp.]|nr:FtsX-like permease family protein [Anaeromyxobacter sp.]